MMNQGHTSNRLFALAVLIGGASYGCVSPVVKIAYRHGFSASDVTAGQFYYAMIILWAISLITAKGKLSFRGISPMDIWRMIALGLLGTGTAIFYYRALTVLPAWLAIILLFQFSWITFVIDYLVRRKIPTHWQWYGIVLIVLGTVLANIHTQATQHLSMVGMVEGVLSGVSYAMFLYINGSLKAQVSPFLRAAMITTVSAIAVSCIYVPSVEVFVAARQGMWAYGLLIGLLSQAIPTSLFAIGIPRVGGSAAAILSSSELPVAVVLSALILHEQVDVIAWLGVLLIIIGIVVGQRQQRRFGMKWSG